MIQTQNEDNRSNNLCMHTVPGCKHVQSFSPETKANFVCKLFHANWIFHNYLIYFMELTTASFMISYQIILMQRNAIDYQLFDAPCLTRY